MEIMPTLNKVMYLRDSVHCLANRTSHYIAKNEQELNLLMTRLIHFTYVSILFLTEYKDTISNYGVRNTS